MKLYLVRHGDAVDKETDPDRPLSPQGRGEAEILAAFVRQNGLNSPFTWHSGKTRALQTAEILIDRGGLGGTLIEKGGLGPNDPVEPVAEQIRDHESDLTIVGHLPFMGKLTSRLVTGQADSSDWAFPCCGMLCLERKDTGGWTVRWFVGPPVLPNL